MKITVDLDGAGDGSREEIAEERALVVGMLLVRELPMVVCIVAGPEPKENNEDEVEKHSLLSTS